MGIDFNHETYLISASSGSLSFKDSNGSDTLAGFLYRLVTRYIHGLELAWSSNTQITIGEGQCKNSSDATPIVSTAEITVDITSSGANGLDTGTEASSTLYHVYIIGDSDGENATAGLLSESVSSPTLPSGYDVFRRLGTVLNNSSSNIEPFFQSGVGNQRIIYYDVDPAVTNTRVIGGGNDTTFTTLDCSGSVPSTSRQALAQIVLSGGTTSAAFFQSTSLASNPLLRYQPTQSTGKGYLWLVLNGSQEVQYKIGNAGHSISVWIVGYMDNL